METHFPAISAWIYFPSMPRSSCIRCGEVTPRHVYPAKSMRCNKCNQYGHFGRYCNLPQPWTVQNLPQKTPPLTKCNSPKHKSQERKQRDRARMTIFNQSKSVASVLPFMSLDEAEFSNIMTPRVCALADQLPARKEHNSPDRALYSRKDQGCQTDRSMQITALEKVNTKLQEMNKYCKTVQALFAKSESEKKKLQTKIDQCQNEKESLSAENNRLMQTSQHKTESSEAELCQLHEALEETQQQNSRLLSEGDENESQITKLFQELDAANQVCQQHKKDQTKVSSALRDLQQVVATNLSSHEAHMAYEIYTLSPAEQIKLLTQCVRSKPIQQKHEKYALWELLGGDNVEGMSFMNDEKWYQLSCTDRPAFVNLRSEEIPPQMLLYPDCHTNTHESDISSLHVRLRHVSTPKFQQRSNRVHHRNRHHNKYHQGETKVNRY